MVNAIIDRLKRAIEQRLSRSQSPIHELKNCFADIDNNGDGFVSKIEFRDAMDSLKVSKY